MPRKIDKTEVCDHLLKWAVTHLDTTAYESTYGESRITYRDFRTAMQRDDFISSEPTIRSKWTMLASSGIISAPAKNYRNGVLYWFGLRMGASPEIASAMDRIVEKEKKQKNKNTDTEGALA